MLFIEQTSYTIFDKLGQTTSSLNHFVPELTISLGLIFLIFLGLIFKSKSAQIGFAGTLLILLVSLYFDYLQWTEYIYRQPISLFLSLIRLDTLGIYYKFLVDLSGILTVVLTFFYVKNLNRAVLIEYFAIILSIALGVHIMVMAINLLTVFISIELVSLSSYIATGFLFNKKGAEAGLKYLLFGALSSGCMLYGMSLFYGFTGTLDFTSPVFFEALSSIPLAPLLLGVLLTLSGIFFKISLFPFHLWTPDIYEGSPTPIVAFFSIVPKAGSLVLLVRLISFNHLPSQGVILSMLSIISLASIFIGNLGALMQKSFKRMLAYSSIAQAGFIVLGIVANSSFGLTAMSFYITIYMIMNFGTFLVAQILERITFSDNMETFKGVGLSNNILGTSLLIAMISLAGLPPTAGFLSKLFIFSALWDTYRHSLNPLMLWIFILGLLNVVISLFYYLKVPYLMFFKTSEGNFSAKATWIDNGSIALLIIPLLFLFFRSKELIDIINYIGLNFN